MAGLASPTLRAVTGTATPPIDLLAGDLYGEKTKAAYTWMRANSPVHYDAIEEMLRWVSPIKNMNRTITHDVELEGQQLKAGDQLTRLPDLELVPGATYERFLGELTTMPVRFSDGARRVARARLLLALAAVADRGDGAGDHCA